MKKILLYPGGFKPLHDGHCMLLDSVLKEHSNELDGVIIITSTKPRDNVKLEYVEPVLFEMIRRMTMRYSVPFYYDKVEVSPILQCYNTVNDFYNNDEGTQFAILTSNKGNDYNRAINFYEQHKVGGKYNNGKWDYDKAFMLTGNIKANGLSATDLRKYIEDDRLDMFMSGYTYMLDYCYTTKELIKNMYTNIRSNIIS